MKFYIERLLQDTIIDRLKHFPIVAILGPRQCGKSTLAKRILKGIPAARYLDLELSSDLNKLSDPEAFFRLNRDSLICLDEIHRKPDIFMVLRSVSDMSRKNGQFMILGSASSNLLKQSSESLAGRIAYLDLTPFSILELPSSDLRKHWLRGGFPDSVLADSDEQSFIWRDNFIRTYMERDIPGLGLNITTQVLKKLLTMLGHTTGQIFNSSTLSESLGVSHPTVRAYLDILEQTFIARMLQPYFANVKKRLVRRPKVYLRDSGILHTLLGIENQNDLLGHPVYGNSWETYALEQISTHFNRWQHFFYRTSGGSEIDLILERGVKKIAVEFKVSTAPKVSAGFYHAIDDLKIESAYVVSPLLDGESYPLRTDCTVCTLNWFLKKHRDIR
jgi:predicted AAA+ superfamily ATPase